MTLDGCLISSNAHIVSSPGDGCLPLLGKSGNHHFQNGQDKSNPHNFAEGLASILKGYLASIAYKSPTTSFINDALEKAMVANMKEYGIQRSAILDKALRLSSTFAEFCYPHLTFEEKLNAALFTCYFFYVDDVAPEHPEVFEVFEYRLIHGLPQLDPVLTAYIDVLKRMWDIYDTESARTIFAACVQFVTISCMEPHLPRVEHASHCSSKFPWAIRQRSGMGSAYACFTFPKRLQVPHMTYLQVLPDMDFILCIINDLFSFYKEEMDGEDFNFVHVRARAENKSPMQVVVDMSVELQDAHRTVHAALGSFPQALKCWMNLERGIVVFHLAQGRYRLGELGIHL